MFYERAGNKFCRSSFKARLRENWSIPKIIVNEIKESYDIKNKYNLDVSVEKDVENVDLIGH